MARERLSMRKIKEVIRLSSLELTNRQIARSTGIARSTIAEYLMKANEAKLSWPLPESLDDAAIERLLFGRRESGASGPLPDYGYIHTELKKKGVTLRLLWGRGHFAIFALILIPLPSFSHAKKTKTRSARVLLITLSPGG